MPQDAPDANKKECLLASSELNLVEGHIGDAGRQAAAAAAEHDLFDLSTLKEPYRAEGKKTMGLEIAPTTGLAIARHHCLSHRRRHRHHRYAQGFSRSCWNWAGWKARFPRFIAVQAMGCQPIVKAYRDSEDTSEPWANAQTVADGLRVASPLRRLSHIAGYPGDRGYCPCGGGP